MTSDDLYSTPDDRVWLPSLASPQPVPAVTPEPAPPHPNFWWALLWCLGFMIVTQLLAGVLAGVGIVVYDLVRSANPREYLENLQSKSGTDLLQKQLLAPALFLSQVFVIGFSLLVLRLVVGRDWTRQVGLRRPALKHLLLALAGFPGLVIAGGAIHELARQFLPGFHELGLDVESQVKDMATLPVAFLVLMIGVGPGIGEELWFRGFLGRGQVGNYGVVVGVLLTSLFFGAMHVDPPQACGAAALGLGLHLVYLATRSLWVPMLLHFMNNSLAVIALLVMKEMEDAKAGGAEMAAPADPTQLQKAALYVAAAVLLAAVGWAFYRSRARIVPEPGAIDSWFPACPGVEHPPPGSGAIVVRSRLGQVEVAAVVVAFACFVGAFVLAGASF